MLSSADVLGWEVDGLLDGDGGCVAVGDAVRWDFLRWSWILRWDFMVVSRQFIVVSWDLMGYDVIYPLVNCHMTGKTHEPNVHVQ